MNAPMNAREFFPAASRWRFHELNSGTTVPFTLRRSDGPAGAVIDLSTPDATVPGVIFDRLTVREASVELNRVRYGRLTIDVVPPLTITPGPEPDHVADLFPGARLSFGPSSGPYDGRVTSKTIGEVSEAPMGRQVHWDMSLVSRATNGNVVLRGSFRFLKDIGLVNWVGDVYGVFFVYRRVPAPLIDGDWRLPAQGVTFRLAQDCGAVRGEFQASDVTCELTGRFDGQTLTMDWRSVWSWVNRQEQGHGQLTLSDDGGSLTGRFPLLGTTADWVLVRSPAAAAPAPPPPVPPPARPPAFRPPVARGGRGGRSSPAFAAPSARLELWNMSAERSWRRAINDKKWRADYSKKFEKVRGRKPTQAELDGDSS